MAYAPALDLTTLFEVIYWVRLGRMSAHQRGSAMILGFQMTSMVLTPEPDCISPIKFFGQSTQLAWPGGWGGVA